MTSIQGVGAGLKIFLNHLRVTFSVVSKARKIFDRLFGVLLILIGIVIVIFLIPELLPLIKKSAFLLLELGAPFVKHGLYEDWFMQIIGWTIAIILFRGGKAFLMYSNKLY